jgi:hypothetical protein
MSAVFLHILHSCANNLERYILAQGIFALLCIIAASELLTYCKVMEFSEIRTHQSPDRPASAGTEARRIGLIGGDPRSKLVERDFGGVGGRDAGFGRWATTRETPERGGACLSKAVRRGQSSTAE